MNETADKKSVRIARLFSFRGLIFLSIVVVTCYLVWGTLVATLISCGALAGLLSAAFSVLSNRAGAFQFSMRGLLFLMFVVAVFAVWQQHFLIHSDLAISRIKSLGGSADVRERGDGELESSAHFIRQPIRPRHLNYLRSLPNLTNLDLDYCHIGDVGLSYVGTLTTLKRLDIEDTAITDDGLKQLISLQELEHLIADGNEITDDGLMHLSKLKSLKSLRMRNTKITAIGIEKFKKILPGCQIVDY